VFAFSKYARIAVCAVLDAMQSAFEKVRVEELKLQEARWRDGERRKRLYLNVEESVNVCGVSK
jgi:hypothetical protein